MKNLLARLLAPYCVKFFDANGLDQRVFAWSFTEALEWVRTSRRDQTAYVCTRMGGIAAVRYPASHFLSGDLIVT